jgi:hypothetical protein
MTATIDAPFDTTTTQGPLAELRSADAAPSERLIAAQQRRAAARTRDLTALLRERPDLAGVHAPADFAVDAVRWCA